MNIKKFKNFTINEGIDTDQLNTEQKNVLQEVQESDLSALDDKDLEYYANKIGISVEKLLDYLADSGIPNIDNNSDDGEEDEVQFLKDELLKDKVQKELIDDPEVNAGNLEEKIDGLVDELQLTHDDEYNFLLNTDNSYYNSKLDVYQSLEEIIKDLYNDLMGINNPDQIEMEFESKFIKNFKNFK